MKSVPKKAELRSRRWSPIAGESRAWSLESIPANYPRNDGIHIHFLCTGSKRPRSRLL